MDRQEVINCMREAVAALAEFRNVLPEHSREADSHVIEARRHVAKAIALLEAQGDGDRFGRWLSRRLGE